MTYMETLHLARKHNINALTLDVAEELCCLLDNNDITLKDNEFEYACYLIERAYLKTENLTINAITKSLINMIEVYGELDVIEMRELIERACWY